MKKSFSLLAVMVLTLMLLVVGCGARGGESGDSGNGGEVSKEKPIVIKFSHVATENAPKGLAATMFEEKAEKYTNGRVDVQVFPNSQLYNDDEIYSAIQQNNVQMAAPTTSKVSKLSPEWTLFDLPFAFANTKEVQAAMTDPEIGGVLFKTLADKDILGLGMWDNGFKQMTLDDRPLIKPEDFQGKKFRVMSSNVLEAQFEALGANPVPMPYSEVYSALEQGVIDGQENTLSNIYTKKFFEVQKYMTLSNHGYLGYAVLTNKTFWEEELPDDIRKQLEKALNETTQWVRENGQKINQDMLKKIRAAGTLEDIHELTPEEKQAWVDATSVVYEQFEEKIGKDLIEKIKAIDIK